MECSEVPEFVCSHVEADTRLACHLSVLANTVPGLNVVIRATDADIIVILLYHARCVNTNVCMVVGHSSLNTR